jgi:DNA-binding NtrC family response regulator
MPNKPEKKGILFVSLSAKAIPQFIDKTILSDFNIFEARSPSQTISILENEKIDILFLDIQEMPYQEMDFVNYIKTKSPNTEVVILATINELELATKALRSGAAFYLIKPVKSEDLKIAAEKLSLKADNISQYRELEQKLLSDLMAGSPVMQRILKLATKIAPTSSTVLICGESGTGKEFFAKLIHHLSQRTEGKFVAVNCGAIPETLFESELFGHIKGSFTGADKDRAGLVEEAHLGTLFLDEIGELSPSAQVKLLRFLQERTFKRIGENIQRTVNVRVIAATNKDLQTLVTEKKFREDLFYRINVFCLHLPPLRARKETIPNLIKLFIHKNNEILGKNVLRLSPAAEAILLNYDYPGNIRQLENIIEHAMVLAEGSEITEKELPDFLFKDRLLLDAPKSVLKPQEKELEFKDEEILPLQEIEKNYILRVLEAKKYNYSETAKKLKISRSTLWRKIKELNLEKYIKKS